jgi:ADP-heptose:LPS heptosyltransferase
MQIQQFRRALTKGIAGLFTSSYKHQPTAIDPNLIKKVLIIRPNHRLGNQLLVTPLFQEIENLFPNAVITFFGKGDLSKYIFSEFKQVKHFINLPKKHFNELPKYMYCWLKIIFKKYDIAINVTEGSSSGQLLLGLSNAKYKIVNAEKANKTLNIIEQNHGKKPVECLRKFFNLNLEKPYPKLSLNLKPPPKSETNWYKENTERLEKPVAFLFTYATGAKKYENDFWLKIYDTLQQKLPNYHIVELLPIENISAFDFKIDSYYSNDILEMCKTLANGNLFIGADCGVMHLAVASGISTLGLFKFDNIDKYHPYGNNATYIDTRINGVEKIVEKAITIL